MRLTYSALAAIVLLASCKQKDTAVASAAPASATPAHVDSVLPRDEEMRRFTADLGPAPTALADGETSRDALVRRFVTALETRDTAALRVMRITKAEFAHLYYPTSPLGKPPYDLSPALMYFQLEGNSSKGLAHALAERGGKPLGYVDHACAKVDVQGTNRLHQLCTVRRVQAPGDTTTESLFGAILERDGRFKFVSYANKL